MTTTITESDFRGPQGRHRGRQRKDRMILKGIGIAGLLTMLIARGKGVPELTDALGEALIAHGALELSRDVVALLIAYVLVVIRGPKPPFENVPVLVDDQAILPRPVSIPHRRALAAYRSRPTAKHRVAPRRFAPA